MGDAGSIRKPNALENWSILEDKMKDKKVRRVCVTRDPGQDVSQMEKLRIR